MIILYAIIVFAFVINLYPSEKGLSRERKLLFVWWWFLNDDDPITQDKYRKRYRGQPVWLRHIRHGIRNPLANFCRYTIGFKDKQGLLRGSDMWPDKGFPIAITLPWISFKFKNGINGYIGWNINQNAGPDSMNNGAFVIAIRRQSAV